MLSSDAAVQPRTWTTLIHTVWHPTDTYPTSQVESFGNSFQMTRRFDDRPSNLANSDEARRSNRSPLGNKILRALPDSELRLLLTHLESFQFKQHAVLH